MIDEPAITKTAPQLAAAIHMTIPRSQIRLVMGPGLTEIMTALQAQGIAPAGPWFTHHLKMDPATFDFEICVPISAPVASLGRVTSRDIPSLTVARTVYKGSYEQLAAAWGELNRWIAKSGHVPGPDLFEYYVAGPESNPNPAEWRTELRRPLLQQL